MKIQVETGSLIRFSTLVLLLGGALFYMLYQFSFGFNTGDEGVALMGAWRIVSGETPHRDFFEVIPPFSFLPTALAFSLFGATLATSRALVFLYAVLLIAISDRLLRCISSNHSSRMLLVGFLVPFGVYYWPMPSHHWVVDLLQLAAIWSLIRGLEVGRIHWRWGAGAGVLCALACFTLQDQGAYLVLALGVLFFPWIENREIRRKLAISWAVGGLAVCAVFALYLLPSVSLQDLYHQWIQFPATSYKGIPGNNSGFLRGVLLIGSSEWVQRVGQSPVYTLSWSFAAIFIVLLPLLSLVALVVAWFRGWESKERIRLLFAASVAFLGACLHRYALLNVIWASPVLLIIVAWALGRLQDVSFKSIRIGARFITFAILASCVLYAASQIPLNSSDRTLDVSGRAGTLSFYRQDRTRATQILLDAIERHVGPGDTLVVTGYTPLLNFWAQARNPTRFNFLIAPSYHQEAHVAEWVDTLRASPNTLVLAFYPLSMGAVVEQFLSAEYRRVWNAGFAALLERRDRPQR